MGPTPGQKLQLHPTNLTYSTPVMGWKGLGGCGLATGWRVRRVGWAFLVMVSQIADFSDELSIRQAQVKQSHEPTSVREREMSGPAFRRFKSVFQVQRYLTAHAAVHNLFNFGRYIVRASHYRNLRVSAFSAWSMTVT
jgi:hypothetical protein